MAAEYNLYIDQGTTFSTQVTIADDFGNPVDLTSASLASQIRRSFIAKTAYPFTITVNDATSGIITLSLTATQTAAMTAGRYVYDAQYNIGGTIVRFLKGLVTIFPASTQVTSS